MKFTIEIVSKMTGIPAASLRNWEKRYGFPRPERTANGHRFYCSWEVNFLKKANELMEKGICLSEISSFYLKCKSSGGELIEPSHQKPITDDVAYRVQLLYESLLRFDQAATQLHFAILNAKLSPENLFDFVFENILLRLGNNWIQGLISVAQEHYASSFVRLKLCSFLAIEFPTTQNFRILAASLTEEKHEGGLLLVAAHLKMKGYPIQFFGVDLPIIDLQSICIELCPHAVILSYFNSDRLEADIDVLNGFGVPIIIGGMALFNAENVIKWKSKNLQNIYFCEQKIGSEAAQFVEYICQSK